MALCVSVSRVWLGSVFITSSAPISPQLIGVIWKNDNDVILLPRQKKLFGIINLQTGKVRQIAENMKLI